MSETTRTLAQLAQEALDVQDACNLTGVALSFSRAMCDLRTLVGGGDSLRAHPVTVLWMDKLMDMIGRVDTMTAYAKAYDWAVTEAAPVAEARR